MFKQKKKKEKNDNSSKHRKKDLLCSSNPSDFSLKDQKVPEATKRTSGNIYIYVGTYEINDEKNVANPNDFPTLYDSPNAQYRSYINIEMPNKERKITIFDQQSFERENIVLYPPKGVSKIEFFDQVSEKYFDSLNKYGQEKAIEIILEFQNNLEEKTISLEELIDHINNDDDEDFDLELHPSEQELKLSNNKIV